VLCSVVYSKLNMILNCIVRSGLAIFISYVGSVNFI
jgi:hypothetical protein